MEDTAPHARTVQTSAALVGIYGLGLRSHVTSGISHLLNGRYARMK